MEIYACLPMAKKFGQVLTNAQEKWYIPERADGKPWELRLQLSREPQMQKQIAAPKTPGQQ